MTLCHEILQGLRKPFLKLRKALGILFDLLKDILEWRNAWLMLLGLALEKARLGAEELVETPQGSLRDTGAIY